MTAQAGGEILAGRPVRRRSEDSLTRVKSYICAHVREPISVSILASVAGMETTAFARYIRRKTGMTPKFLVCIEKVRYADRLSLLHDMSHQALADEVGLSAGAFRRAVLRVRAKTSAAIENIIVIDPVSIL